MQTKTPLIQTEAAECSVCRGSLLSHACSPPRFISETSRDTLVLRFWIGSRGEIVFKTNQKGTRAPVWRGSGVNPPSND